MKKWCLLKSILHFNQNLVFKMMNLSDLFLASIPNIFREVKICVCTIVCFCREINRLVVLHQDVHRCRPLAHPLGRWCQGCARGVLAAWSEIMRSSGRNANQIPIFFTRQNKYILLSTRNLFTDRWFRSFLPFAPYIFILVI